MKRPGIKLLKNYHQAYYRKGLIFQKNHRYKTMQQRPWILSCDKEDVNKITRFLLLLRCNYEFVDTYGTWTKHDRYRYEVDDRGRQFLQTWFVDE